MAYLTTSNRLRKAGHFLISAPYLRFPIQPLLYASLVNLHQVDVLDALAIKLNLSELVLVIEDLRKIKCRIDYIANTIFNGFDVRFHLLE